MTQVLPSRSSPFRTFSAIALFLVVYGGVLVLVFAPKDLISAQSGVAIYSREN